MSVTLPGDGTVVATANVGGAEQQIVQVSSLPAVALDATALAALASAATPATQAVSLASSPLPTGAATATGVAAVVTALGSPLQAGGSVAVSNFPGTQAVSGPVTDTQLRATPVPVSGTVAVTGTFFQTTQPISASALPLPSGAATQTTLASVLAAAGAPADSSATTDSGTFSLIALTKRLLWKLPAALGAQTSAASLGVVLASDQAIIPVNTLGQPGVARKLAAAVAGGTSANVALTTTVRRISIVATGSALRYTVGTGTPVASSTSHYIQLGERLDLAVPANGVVAVLSDTATVGSLEITELT